MRAYFAERPGRAGVLGSAPMRVLVTGAAGFIGSHVVARLLARGDAVTGLDNFDPFYDPARKRANLAGLTGDFRLVTGDLLDPAALDASFGTETTRPDAVIHLAALAGVRPSLAEPARYQRVNVEGTARLTEACLARGVRRIVFASSSSVYGANTKVPFAETDRVDDPVSPYAASKRAGELLLRAFVHNAELSVAALRYFTVYGPRQRPEMAIHAFTRAIDGGEPVRLHGDGSSSRDYTYVDDVVDGTVAALDRPKRGLTLYNLGGERTTRLGDLVTRIAAALGKEARVVHGPEMPGDVPITFASVERARAELGYSPKTSIDEGLARFVAWYRAEGR